jgi:hypothetical protein
MTDPGNFKYLWIELDENLVVGLGDDPDYRIKKEPQTLFDELVTSRSSEDLSF